MNDLIQNEFILFAENYSELENIIKNKKESRKKVNIDEIFKKNALHNIKLEIEKLIS